MIKWFRCLSEVPGVGYKGNPHINRSQLPDHGRTPTIGSYQTTNERHEYLSWSTPNGTTSASPAKQWKTQARNGESAAQTCLRQLYETLELPGELSDYHFAIQGCCSVMWRLRQEEPWVFVEIEQFCWLDLRLIQAYPDFVTASNEYGFFKITAFERLLHLYEQEGYLYEALKVAEIAVKFHQQEPALERIKSRIANLELEGES